jgi:hypothetical protein
VLFPLPGNYGDEPANTPTIDLKDSSPGELSRGIDQLSQGFASSSAGTSPSRVNPNAIKLTAPGNIFYYAHGSLLQLVMFAPDGTYVEHVDQAPNGNWLGMLNIQSKGRSFPADLYADEVLYYLERLLPRHYNLIRFMSNHEPVDEPALQAKTAGDRLAMAREIGVTVFNPFTKHAAKVGSDKPQPGELVAAAPSAAAAVAIVLRSGEVVTLNQLSAGVPPTAAGKGPGQPRNPGQPVKPHGPPPLGGRKM